MAHAIAAHTATAHTAAAHTAAAHVHAAAGPGGCPPGTHPHTTTSTWHLPPIYDHTTTTTNCVPNSHIAMLPGGHGHGIPPSTGPTFPHPPSDLPFLKAAHVGAPHVTGGGNGHQGHGTVSVPIHGSGGVTVSPYVSGGYGPGGAHIDGGGVSVSIPIGW